MQQSSSRFMQVLRGAEALQKYRSEQKGKCSFVPTMGALHEGHLELVRKAKSISDFVIVSVFVNPTQFNNSEDLQNYPRDEEGDARMLESAGCDAVWFPSVEEIYPSGARSEDYDLGIMDEVMEGEFRPGHFQGVATVVDRLFQFIKPDLAVFGEKDYQQVAVVRSMVEQRGHAVDVVVHKTVREPNGLAMSSRNRRLSEEEKDRAAVMHQTMTWVKGHKGERSPQDLLKEARTKISDAGFDLEYLEIADENTMEFLESWDDSDVPRIFVAACSGPVRLIDNISLI